MGPIHYKRGSELHAKPTEAQILERDQFAIRLLEGGANRRQTIEALMLPKQPKGSREPGGMGLTLNAAENTYRRVQKRLHTDFEAERKYFKSDQVNRLRSASVRMLQQGKFASYVQAEALLSKITGTQEPLRVQVDESRELRAGIAAVIASLTPEEAQERIERQRELERLAAERRGQLNGSH